MEGTREMAEITIIGDVVRQVDATVESGRFLLDPTDLPVALGWQLKPAGLCREDVCVPVRDRTELFVGDQLDLAAVASALRRPLVIDAEAGIAAVALPAETRRDALSALVAAPFTLPDLDGNLHELSEWRGRKRLLFAFSTW
jgi:hypothetical protein